jgi:hypothetical protein
LVDDARMTHSSKRWSPPFVPFAASALLILAVACGDDKDSGAGGASPANNTSTTTTSQGSGGAAQGGGGAAQGGGGAAQGGGGAAQGGGGAGGGGAAQGGGGAAQGGGGAAQGGGGAAQGGGGAAQGGGGSGGAGGGLEQAVGPEGATLATDGVTVTIPADALKEATAIGVHRLDGAAIAALPAISVEGMTAATLTPVVFALTPHGTSFQSGVTIELPAADDTLTVLKLDDASDTTWEIVPAAFSGGVAKITTYGFSIYAVADIDGTPGCDPAWCAANGEAGAECVFTADTVFETFWSCRKPCTHKDQCSFTAACIDATTQQLYGWWCGIAPGHASGGCQGMMGANPCHGSDGQNPGLTLCVNNECTDTPAQ